MADHEAPTVAESASTSAPAETVEVIETPVEATEAAQPLENADPWKNLGVEEAPEEKAEEAKTEEPAKEEGEKDLADEVLEEVFAEADKPGESDEKDELDKADPQEMIAAQRNKHAKEWAQRNYEKAEIIKAFQFDTPIAEVAEKFKSVSEERFTELSQYAAHEMVDKNPEAAFRRAYAVTMLSKDPNWDYRTATIPSLDDLIASNGNKPETAEPAPELKSLTAELDNTLDFDWRDPANDDQFLDDREKALATSLREMEKQALASTSAKSELEKKLEKIEKDLKGLQEGKAEGQTAAIQTELKTTITDYRKGIEDKLVPYIAKNTGLEVSKQDTPEIIKFKENKMKLYTGTDYQRAHGEDSAFESFAYQESSVKSQLNTVVQRVIDIQLKESAAKLAKDTAAAAKYHAEAEDERIPLLKLLGQASKEFKELYIDPDMALIGQLSTQLTEPIKEQSERVEVTSNGGPTGADRPQKPNYETVDDVFAGAVASVAKDEALRVGA